MVSLSLAVVTTRGFIFHPHVRIAFIGGFVFILFAFDDLVGILVMCEFDFHELYGKV